jgi:hypothetical protein
MLAMKFPSPAADMLLDAYAAAVGQPALVTSTVLDVTGAPARSFPRLGHGPRRRFRDTVVVRDARRHCLGRSVD